MTIKYLDSKRISASPAEYKVHSFTSGGTFAVTGSGDVEYLVVAGGGGCGTSAGGGFRDGGGGAGGLLTATGHAVTAQSYSITVGAGGTVANNGTNSVFDTITSVGGGKGGTSSTAGTAGGSGGGGGVSAGAGGAGSQGNAGGLGGSGGTSENGGGGGGAGSVGEAGSNGGTGQGGDGGIGLANSISGTSTYYAGGGGGRAGNAAPHQPIGGLGGGGNTATSGDPNTGGGGGGYSGAGGSGIVIIRYLTSSSITATGGTITTISEAETKPTNVETNSILVEKDTGKRYWFDGSVWTIDFLPNEISNMEFWYDVSDATTVTKDASSYVTQLSDKSTNGRDLTSASTAYPLWVDSVQNNLPVIKFDGINDYLSNANVDVNQPSTFFFVYKASVDVVDSETLFDTVTASPSTDRIVHQTDFDVGTYDIFAGAIAVSGNILDTTNFNQFSMVVNGASSTLSRQGVEIISAGTNVGSGTLNGITIGSAFSGGQRGAPWLAEFIAYNKLLTAEETALVELYLNEKWGL